MSEDQSFKFQVNAVGGAGRRNIRLKDHDILSNKKMSMENFRKQMKEEKEEQSIIDGSYN